MHLCVSQHFTKVCKTREYGKLARLKQIMMLALGQGTFIASVVKGKRVIFCLVYS